MGNNIIKVWLFCHWLMLASSTLIAQNLFEQIHIQGYTQVNTYHISYCDSLTRDLQPEIEGLLETFDFSVSTYNPQSIISRINNNEPNVILDAYFITCFNKAKEAWKNTNHAFYPTVYPLVNLWGFGTLSNKTIDKSKIDSVKQFVGFHLIELKNGKIIKKVAENYKQQPELFKSLTKPCKSLWVSIYLEPSGTVFPCSLSFRENEGFGNLVQSDFKSVWNNSNYNAARGLFKNPSNLENIPMPCKGCKYFLKCTMNYN
jgi:radical SAM protein with 4Fe4S-binding SPASM domain